MHTALILKIQEVPIWGQKACLYWFDFHNFEFSKDFQALKYLSALEIDKFLYDWVFQTRTGASMRDLAITTYLTMNDLPKVKIDDFDKIHTAKFFCEFAIHTPQDLFICSKASLSLPAKRYDAVERISYPDTKFVLAPVVRRLQNKSLRYHFHWLNDLDSLQSHKVANILLGNNDFSSFTKKEIETVRREKYIEL